jgi:hypothetical protein
MACSLVFKNLIISMPYDSGITDVYNTREQPYQLYVTKATLNSEHAKGMIVCT